jgi:hypothetical protein
MGSISSIFEVVRDGDTGGKNTGRQGTTERGASRTSSSHVPAVNGKGFFFAPSLSQASTCRTVAFKYQKLNTNRIPKRKKKIITGKGFFSSTGAPRMKAAY